jgi:site-specific recombinase XerD
MGAFLAWLRANQKNLATVDTASIANFVGELPIRKTQRMRYLRLIERVLDHIRQTELASTNPARFIAQDGEATWRHARDNEPTGFLTPAERAKLLAYLFSPIGVSGSAYWKERRDRALVAAFLGAGVKTGEARVLTISCINTSGTSLHIPSTHPDFARETHLASFAIALLEAWLVERKRQNIAGDLVFPASHAGRPMHKATMLRAIDAIVESAGLHRRALRARVRRRSATRTPRSCSSTMYRRNVSANGSASCGPFHRTGCTVRGRTGERNSSTVMRRIGTKLTEGRPAAYG